MATRPGPSRFAAIIFAAALVATLPILWLNVLPLLSGAKLGEHAPHGVAVYVHGLGGLAMLILGAGALYIGTTRRAFAWHRWFGYGYLGLGSVGAVAALILSIEAPHAPASLYIATATLSLVWLAFAAMAWRAARNRRFDSHREWVIRSYVVTWTFVGCRLATMVDFYPWLGAESITAAIWVNWIVPVLLCEIVLQWKRGARLTHAPPSPTGHRATGPASAAAPRPTPR